MNTYELEISNETIKRTTNLFWVESSVHHFACNVRGCPRGANVILTDNAKRPETHAYDVRCWIHCPVEETEVH